MDALSFMDWIRLIEIPAFMGLGGALLRHMASDVQIAKSHVEQLHSLENVLRDRIVSDAKEVATAALNAAEARAERDLANYKLDALKQFATASGLADMELRITRYIDAIDKKLDAIMNRGG